MSKQEAAAQREANRLGHPVWFATGDGGGWWVHPKKPSQ